VYHEHPFALPPAVSVMPLSQDRILRWSYLRLDQSAYHGWLSMMTSSEGPPFFVLPRAPPTLNPPLTTVSTEYALDAFCADLMLYSATVIYTHAEAFLWQAFPKLF